ncbi:MAG: hypothetical protein K6F93_01895 [Lachnospiraceae bacterium]|nr:hypothetical protein [Lachnospiraceae bacterium]
MKSKKETIVRIVKLVSALCAAVIVFAALQRLVTPKYTEGDMAEGGLIASYYDSEKDHDVIFLGDCEVYENFAPGVIEKESGLKCYIRGSAQQLIWQSYYLLEDTLRYETPKAVVFNVLSLKYNEPQNEAYNRMTLEGMEWSGAKLASIKASMTEDESFITYVFPVLRYHDRIRDLNADDFKYFFSSPKLTTDGSYLREGVVPAENVPDGKPLASYEFGDKAWEYMEKMRLLCEEKGIRLVLIKAPSVYPFWYDEWDRIVSEYAEKYGLSYINLLDRTRAGSTGVDLMKHTYDAGLHLNREGAQQLSRFFSPILKSVVEDADKRIVDKKDVGKAIDTPATGSSAGTDATGSADTKAEGSADTKAEGSNAYVFKYKGLALTPGMGWDEKTAEALGEPISYFEAKSCVFEGIDRMYTYPGFEVDVSPDGMGGEAVTTIYLLDDSVTTPEGAYIGCGRNLIEKLYGANESLEYIGGETVLEFVTKDETVVGICYRMRE